MSSWSVSRWFDVQTAVLVHCFDFFEDIGYEIQHIKSICDEVFRRWNQLVVFEAIHYSFHGVFVYSSLFVVEKSLRSSVSYRHFFCVFSFFIFIVLILIPFLAIISLVSLVWLGMGTSGDGWTLLKKETCGDTC